MNEKHIKPKQKSNAYRDFVLKCFKLLFNLFLVLILIGGVIASRGGLQILASQLGDHDMRFTHVSVWEFKKMERYFLFFIC